MMKWLCNIICWCSRNPCQFHYDSRPIPFEFFFFFFWLKSLLSFECMQKLTRINAVHKLGLENWIRIWTMTILTVCWLDLNNWMSSFCFCIHPCPQNLVWAFSFSNAFGLNQRWDREYSMDQIYLDCVNHWIVCKAAILVFAFYCSSHKHN